MTAKEKIREILALIEELNPESELLTADPDIQAKIFSVINHVMFELARLKKIPVYVEIPAEDGELLTFGKIGEAAGGTVYQLGCVRGVTYDSKASGTVLKIREGGVAEIDDLQNKLIKLARGGFKHHTAICEGHYKAILEEAFTTYLGYDWVDIDR